MRILPECLDQCETCGEQPAFDFCGDILCSRCANMHRDYEDKDEPYIER